ncbi:MAG: AsmA family protein [Rhodoferax sp.]|nr:AsmA family protein [Rhodoferax sp.]
MKISFKSPWIRWPAWLASILIALAGIAFFFPWDLLRGPLNHYVSDLTGRRFEITRRLNVRLGWTTRVIADGIEFANPAWAHDPYLLKAEAAQFEVRLWPLLHGKLELPAVSLRKPQLSLQIEPDGKRTWALGKDTSDRSTVPEIGRLQVDNGTLHYVGHAQGADILVDFGMDARSNAALPLSYSARGVMKKQAFTAQGRTGSVLQLSSAAQQPFPVELQATAGRTALKASGSIAGLAALASVDATFDIHGQSLAELYTLLGVVLPQTPPYALRGNLRKQGGVWAVRKMQGRLGQSDLSGDMRYDRSRTIPLLTGKLQSRELDFDDLGPLIGASPTPDATAATPLAQPRRRVLPDSALDFERLKVMDADVWYAASDIRHIKALPLDRMSVHVRLANGVLQMDPMNLGVAGGQLAGKIRIDANAVPAAVSAQLQARALQLNRLFPTIELTKGSLGKLHGQVDLQGRGNSTAQVLGSASGSVALLMGEGQISRLLLAEAGLDGGKIITFLVVGDKPVLLRCAAAAFDVKNGLMSSRSLVLDTSTTVINGSGTINLADETLDIVLKPEPKDRSILSLRSPLEITGSFKVPSAGPDKTALAGRAGVALALGAINPLLALAATVETGPGEDADCAQVLAQAGATGSPGHSK